MNRTRVVFNISLLLISIFLILPSCEKTIEEDVIKPVEMIVEQKSAAAAQAAVSNVQTVRAALMRYPAVSPSNEYPGEMEILDYRSLRDVLADANLPPDMAELMWDQAYGISYRSDGYTFTFEVKSLSGELIVATPNGVTKN